MTVVYVLIGLLPGIALVGPVLIGLAFDSDWVLRVGLGFDAVAVLLGATAGAIVRGPWMEAETLPPIGSSLIVALGIGLVGFGLLFGGVSVWFLYAADESR